MKTPRTDAFRRLFKTLQEAIKFEQTLETELIAMTAQRDALLACVKTALPVLDDGEAEAHGKANKNAGTIFFGKWLHVAECFKADADAARAAIALCEGGVA